MNYDQVLEAINNAETQETILEVRTAIALSCDSGEITEAEFTELRELCDLSLPLLPTEHAQREALRDDLNRTYYEQTKF